MKANLSVLTRFASSWMRRSWPSYCVIFVTSRCNARCSFCFNWEAVFRKQPEDEITVDQFERLSRSMKPLMQLVLSGGEPYLRKDLAGIVSAFYRNSGTRLIAIPTNGYLPQAVEEITGDILDDCPDLTLNVNLSIDAIGEEHDALRGVKGQFHKILDSYARLDALRERFPNLNVNAQTVVSKFNLGSVDETIRYLNKELDLGFHAVGAVRGSTPQADAKEITAEQIGQVYETADAARCGRRKASLTGRLAEALLDRIREIELRAMGSDKREFTCLAGGKMVVISHDAKVYPCEPLWCEDETRRVFPQDAMMGDLRETGFDIRPILSSERAASIRSDVGKKYCACMYGCAIYNGLLFAPSTYPATLRRALEGRRVR